MILLADYIPGHITRTLKALFLDSMHFLDFFLTSLSWKLDISFFRQVTNKTETQGTQGVVSSNDF